MIDLRSDTVTLPSKEMRQFMLNAPIGDDVYGEDDSINSLENKAAHLFNKESALFVPSGTMANLISVLTHCNRGEEVLLGDKSHIFIYEAGGVSAFGGIHSYQLHNNDDGTIDIKNIKDNIRKTNDDHFPKTKLLCLENTHNLCYGSVLNSEYFKNVSDVIQQHNIKLHIDGARIFNASIALNTPVNELAKYADSISCCLSKGLGCPSGSLIMGSNQFIIKARKIRKALGGGMRQAGILAAAGIYALDNMIERLIKDHINALNLANGLKKIKNIDIDINKVQTNLVFFYLHNTNLTDQQFIDKLLKHKIKIDAKGNHKFRIATHCDFNEEEIDIVLNSINKILSKESDV